MWNGNTAITDSTIIGAIQQFAPNCIVTTGGYSGTYLENVCGDANQLANAYKAILTATGCKSLDVDLEQDAVNNNIDKINQALKIVQQQTGCTVSYTLAANENGLNSMGMAILRSAASQGVNVDTVNPMCMDFPRGSDGTLDAGVINCAKAVYNNMVSIWGSGASYSMLGVTPMIGTQDTGGTFTLNGMSNLANWAQQNGVGHLAFWSLNRDNGGCAGSQSANWACSGVQQSPWDFTRAMQPFCTGGSSTVTQPPTSGPTQPPTTPPSGGGGSCSSGTTSYAAGTCSQQFYQCNNGSPIPMSCAGGTVYNPSNKVCDWPYNVSGCPG